MFMSGFFFFKVQEKNKVKRCMYYCCHVGHDNEPFRWN